MLEASVDDAVSGQLYRAHALLLVCAYVGFLAYFAVTDPDNPVAVLLSGRSQASEPLAAIPPPVVTVKRAADLSVAAGKTVPAVADVAPPPLSEETIRRQERERLSEASQQATRSGEPQERAAAIDQLKSVSPEALQALQAVVTSDSVVRNRIRALNSLRVLAEQDGAKDAVISIVHLAMVDTNASVASRANELYRELTREEPTPVE